MKRISLFSLGLFLLTLSVFASAYSFGPTFCDDYQYVVSNVHVFGGLTLSGLKYAFTDVQQAIWMPLTYLSYMLDYSLGWGYGGMHVQSILWHGASAILLFLLLVRLFRNKTAAFLAALVWAIHPLRVESVVWIASRKDVISTFFLLAALLVWSKAGKTNLICLFLSVGLLVLGVLAKPSVMVFPILALSIDFLITQDRKDCLVYWSLIVFSGLLV